jgi:hypothetical protein
MLGWGCVAQLAERPSQSDEAYAASSCQWEVAGSSPVVPAFVTPVSGSSSVIAVSEEHWDQGSPSQPGDLG